MISKTELHQYCLQLVQSKIVDLEQLIADAQAASNNDTKSSMGDKYETIREMMQIEINKLGQQLAETQQMNMAIKVLDPNKKCTAVEPGAFIETDKILFYLCAGLGKINVNEQTIMVISPGSPLGKAMLNKKANEDAGVNGVVYKIKTIY